MKLGDAMVKEGLINNDVLARALERQIIFGGRLGTNLVEMGAVSEEVLAKFLSKILNVPYAEPGLFENIEQDVLDALPAKLAEKYTAFPIKKERTRLHLAMKDPNDMNLVDEMRFAVGLDVKPYIASEMRILYALDKYYGIKRDLRYVSVLDEERAQKVDPAMAKLAAPAPHHPHASTPITPAPAVPAHEEYLGDESQSEMPQAPAFFPHEGPAAYPPPVTAPPAFEKAPPVYPAPPHAAPAPEKPAAIEDPYEMLASPTDREFVAKAAVTAAVQELKRAALFLVKGNVLIGWKAAGDGLTDDAVASVRVMLDAPSIFKEVVEDKVFYKGPILQVPQNTQLLASLGGVLPPEAIAYPLIIKGKVVAVLYGDNGQGALITGDIERLTGLMTKASMSLEILILKNKILSGS